MHRRAAVLMALLLAATAVSGAALAAQYSLSASPSVEVPERTITYSGESFTVETIARTSPTGTIEVQSTVPEDTLHTVYLYNDEGKIERAERGYGDLSFSVEAGDLTQGPGSYVLVLEKDQIRTIHPVVVSEYRVSLEVPGEITEGDTIDVSGSITSLVANESDPEVVVIVGNSSTKVTTTATLDASPPNTTFSVELATEDLAPGTYSAYAVVQGPEKVSGQRELIGLSDAHQVMIAEATSESGGSETGTSTTTESSSGGSGGGSMATTSVATTTTGGTTTDGTAGENATTSETPTTTTSVPPPTSATESNQAQHTTTNPETQPATGSTSPTSTSNATESCVITPNASSTSATTSTETPLFRPTTVLGVLAGIALLGFRRRV